MTTAASSTVRRPAIEDRPLRPQNGFLMLALGLVFLLGCVWLVVGGLVPLSVQKTALGALGALATWIWFAGLVVLQPNENSRLPAPWQLCRDGTPSRFLVGQSVQF